MATRTGGHHPALTVVCGTIPQVTDSPAAAQALCVTSRGCAASATGIDGSTRSHWTSRHSRAMRTCRPGTSGREFRLAYGESPYGYVMTRRIERAMALLRRGRPQRHRGLLRGRLLVAGTFSSRFTELVRYAAQQLTAAMRGCDGGMPSCVAKQVTKPVRNREARAAGPRLASPP